MSSPNPPPAAPLIPAAQASAHLRDLAGVLRKLLDRGHSIAKAVHERAMAKRTLLSPNPPAHRAEPGEPEPSTIELVTRFTRICRGVRRCILLLQKLHAPPPTTAQIISLDSARATRQRAARARPATTDRAQPAGTPQIVRLVPEDRAAPPTPSRLSDLDADDLDDDEGDDEGDDERGLYTLPLAEIIADICADFGIDPPQDIPGWANLCLDELLEALHQPASGPAPAPPAAPRLVPQPDPSPGGPPPQPPYPLRL